MMLIQLQMVMLSIKESLMVKVLNGIMPTMMLIQHQMDTILIRELASALTKNKIIPTILTKKMDGLMTMTMKQDLEMDNLLIQILQ